VVHWLAMLSCIVLLFVAIVAGVSMHSWLAFFVVIALMVGIAAAASRFDASANPRYSVFTANRVEVDIPGHGRFVVFPPYYLLPRSQPA
jgi:cytochrome b